MTEAARILPARPGETDDEKRLREAINRLTGQLMSTVDAALAFRTAPAEAQRVRHIARGSLRQFAVDSMHAYAITQESRKA